MRRSTVMKLAVGVFGLVFVAFVVRGFGQFVVGSRTALLLAGPIALLAAGLLIVVVAVWLLSWVGLITLERDGTQP